MNLLDVLLAAQAITPQPTLVVSVPPSQICSRELCREEFTPAQMFNLADDLLAKGESDKAVILLKALVDDGSSEYRAEARVRIARIYEARGELSAAAVWYQRLLDEKPEAAAVRVELAQVLAKLGNEAAAGRQLRLAASVRGLPEDVSRALGRIGANIRSNAPFGGSLQIGIAPDSNISRATNAQQIDVFGLPFTLDDDGRAQSGVGLTVNSSAFVRRKMGADIRLVAQVSVDADLYRKSDFNDIAATTTVGPEIRQGRTIYRPLLLAGQRWFGPDKLYHFYGFATSLQRQVSTTAQLTFTASALKFDYATRSDLSGPIFSAGLAYERAITPRLSTRIGLTAVKTDADAAANSGNTLGADATLSRDAGSFTLFGKMGYSRTNGDAPFVALGGTRHDNLYDVEAGIVFRQISAMGLSPLIRVKHTQNRSNLAIFEFKRNRFEFALTKTF
jgi:outer membrane protein